MALLALSTVTAAVTIALDQWDVAAVALLNVPAVTAARLLCFGSVGAVLIARRPDLPFGWLLGLGALCDIALVGVGVPSLALAAAGRGGQLVGWGVALGSLQWLPDVIPGLVNVRFPTGRPPGRPSRWLDRALRGGIAVALLGTYLGDPSGYLDHLAESQRPIDGTPVSAIGDAASALVPVLILLGAVAGITVIVRCVRATGIERRQLQWRAAGVVVALAGFPFAVAEVLPSAVLVVDPVVFVATLLVPVLRYQLWSGDPVPRRRKVGLLVTRRTLVEAREEERRRLRRDLHDGIGPLLTGLRLTLDAVDAQLASDPGTAQRNLATAREASAAAIKDLRSVVEDLRPPAIDELGLVGALRAHLSPVASAAGVELTVAGEARPDLPAAVEVAVYRTATEAVTNVVRHSTARHCRVALATTRSRVRLTVSDDGSVIEPWRPGIGLTSMRERAAELGGTFVAGSGPDGFRVEAAYPGRAS